MKFCSECGAQLPENASFCDSCGHALAQPVMQQVPAQPVQQPEFLGQQQQTQPMQAYAQQQFSSAPVKKKSKLPLILGIGGGAVVVIVVIVLLILNGVRATLNKTAQADYYEIGSDKIPSIKLALGEERKVISVNTSTGNGAIMHEITYAVPGVKQNEDMIAYMDYVREKDGFLLLTDVDFNGPESWGGLGRNSVDEGYEILLQLDYNRTGYTITLVRQEGEVTPNAAPSPTPEPMLEPTPAVIAQNVFDIIDSGTFHMHGVVVGGDTDGSEFEIFKKDGVSALLAKENGMTAHSITKDGRTYYVMEEYKTVVIMEEDPEDVPPIEYDTSRLTYVGEGSGVWDGATYPYSEYTGVKGEGMSYFMDGSVLKGIRVLTPTGNTVEIIIRALDKSVPDSAFEWPASYAIEDETAEAEPWIGLWRYEDDTGVELIHLETSGVFTVDSRLEGETTLMWGDYIISEGSLTFTNLIIDDEPYGDVEFALLIEDDTMIINEVDYYYRVPKEHEAAVLADPLAPYSSISNGN